MPVCAWRLERVQPQGRESAVESRALGGLESPAGRRSQPAPALLSERQCLGGSAPQGPAPGPSQALSQACAGRAASFSWLLQTSSGHADTLGPGSVRGRSTPVSLSQPGAASCHPPGRAWRAREGRGHLFGVGYGGSGGGGLRGPGLPQDRPVVDADVAARPQSRRT